MALALAVGAAPLGYADPVKPVEKAATQKTTPSQKTTPKSASTAKVTSPAKVAVKATAGKAYVQTASVKTPPAKKKSTKKKPAAPKAPEVSQAVYDFIAWVIATGDNRERPFAVIDKSTAQVLVFDAQARPLGVTPALLGSAVGDDSAEGVGDRELNEIPMEERTTPSGRFLAAFGPAYGGKSVLWVDYATSISIHPVLTTPAARKEKRKERLASVKPDDNRITHGCINVSQTFYDKVVRPTFKDNGIFYVMPDTLSIEAAFPAYQPPATAIASNAPGDAR